MYRATITLATLILLTGCTGTRVQDSATGVKANNPNQDTAALVAERWGDCLNKLNAGKPKNEGSLFVTATIPNDAPLTFRIRASNTGNTITMPFDAYTEEKLASVDC